MPTRKKPKPSYSVPEDLQGTPQSGWVYKSGESEPQPAARAAKPARHAPAAAAKEPEKKPEAKPAAEKEPETSASERKSESADNDKSESVASEIFDLTAKTFSSGFATIGNAVALGVKLVSAPVIMGMRALGFKWL